MMRWLVVLAACSSPSKAKLPSASISPDLLVRTTASACGTDISLDGTRVVVAYRYQYDDLGRLASARGRHANGAEDRIDYEWDNLDHMVRSLHIAGGMRAELAAQYSALGDLLEYTMTQTQGPYRDERRAVYSGFTDGGQPTRQQLTERGEQTTYQLDYDATGRIARVAPEAGGVATIYTYDDDARTITIDMGSGAYRGVIAFDEANRQLSEAWSGTDAIATEDLYEWSGDRLQTITFRSGTELAPHQLQTMEIHTFRYNCPQ